MIDFTSKKTVTNKVERYIKCEVEKRTGYIFFTKDKGYCTCCQSEIDTYGRTHCERNICPECGRTVYYIANRYRSKKQDFYYDIMLPEKYGKSLALRLYHVWFRYSIDKTSCKPTIWFDEYARVFYDESGAHFSGNEMKNCGAICKYWDWEKGVYGAWRDFKHLTYHFRDSYFFYEESLPSKLKGTSFEKYKFLLDYVKRAGRKDLQQCEDKCGRKTVRYLELLHKYPSMEYLYKLGFYKLVDDLTQHARDNQNKGINLRGKNLNAVLGTQLSYLQKFDVAGLSELHIKFLKLCKAKNYKISEETFRALQGEINTIERVIDINKVYDIPINKLLGYIAKQAARANQPSKYYFLTFRDYQDYLGECKQLEYDLADEQVLYPRDLREAHARTSGAIEYKKNADKMERFAAVFKKYCKLDFSFEGLSVRLAWDMGEIIKEGKLLRHCVGGYAGKMADGYCLIFFVRKKEEEDKPFYTLELDPKTMQVVQCRGERNGGMTAEVITFIEQWKSAVLTKKHRVKVAVSA